jgi:kynurenine formamidase
LADGQGNSVNIVKCPAQADRCIGVFPWKFVGGEASICRVVAFLEA